MTKIIAKSCLLLALFLCACGNDDNANTEDTQVTPDEIVGRWITSEFFFEGSDTFDQNGQQITQNYLVLGSNIDFFVEFMEDGSFASQGSYTGQLTINQEGQNTQLSYFSNFDNSGSWTRANQLIDLNTTLEDVELTLITLDEQQLIYSYQSNERLPQPGGAAPRIVTLTKTITFTRE